MAKSLCTVGLTIALRDKTSLLVYCHRPLKIEVYVYCSSLGRGRYGLDLTLNR